MSDKYDEVCEKLLSAFNRGAMDWAEWWDIKLPAILREAFPAPRTSSAGTAEDPGSEAPPILVGPAPSGQGEDERALDDLAAWIEDTAEDLRSIGQDERDAGCEDAADEYEAQADKGLALLAALRSRPAATSEERPARIPKGEHDAYPGLIGVMCRPALAQAAPSEEGFEAWWRTPTPGNRVMLERDKELYRMAWNAALASERGKHASPAPDATALRARAIVARIETESALARHEVEHGDGWLYNHADAIRGYQAELEALLRSEPRGEEGRG